MRTERGHFHRRVSGLLAKGMIGAGMLLAANLMVYGCSKKPLIAVGSRELIVSVLEAPDTYKIGDTLELTVSWQNNTSRALTCPIGENTCLAVMMSEPTYTGIGINFVSQGTIELPQVLPGSSLLRRMQFVLKEDPPLGSHVFGLWYHVRSVDSLAVTVYTLQANDFSMEVLPAANR